MDKILAKNKEHLKTIISQSIEEYGYNCDLNFIDTSQITDMSFLFTKSAFNGDISKWDTSNVTDMSFMFYHSHFNGNISQWNTSKVTLMQYMFEKSKFNGDISNWNIYQTEIIDDIFKQSSSKNIPYWATIKDFQERQEAYLERQKILEDKKMLDETLTALNKSQETFKI